MIQVNTLQQDVYVITEDDTVVLVNTDNRSPGLSSVLTVNNDGGAQQIKNIGDPTQNQDAVTLAYFNQHASSLPSGSINQFLAIDPSSAQAVFLDLTSIKGNSDINQSGL